MSFAFFVGAMPFPTVISGNISLDAGVSLTVGRQYGNETSGQLALNIGF